MQTISRQSTVYITSASVTEYVSLSDEQFGAKPCYDNGLDISEFSLEGGIKVIGVPRVHDFSARS